MKGLEGKNILITGGTSGIGQAIAVRFAAEGSHVAINYREAEAEAAQTDDLVHQALNQCINQIAEHGVNHILVQGDVSKEEDVVEMVRNTIEKLGGLDILINNAGIQISGNSHMMTMSQIDAVMNVNLRGAFMCAREAINHFLAKEKPGVVINISSVHQIIPKPRFVGYSMSKGGMQNMTRTLALEYAGHNIRINGVGPGATITPINRAWVDDAEKSQMVLQHIPMGRAGTSDEMAAVTAFLASDDAAYITGQTLYVDGGLTLYPDFRTAWSSE